MGVSLQLPFDISNLADLPPSIRVVDLSHASMVHVLKPIARLALQPNLRCAVFKHCLPIVSNLGDSMSGYDSFQNSIVRGAMLC